MGFALEGAKLEQQTVGVAELGAVKGALRQLFYVRRAEVAGTKLFDGSIERILTPARMQVAVLQYIHGDETKKPIIQQSEWRANKFE